MNGSAQKAFSWVFGTESGSIQYPLIHLGDVPVTPHSSVVNLNEAMGVSDELNYLYGLRLSESDDVYRSIAVRPALHVPVDATITAIKVVARCRQGVALGIGENSSLFAVIGDDPDPGTNQRGTGTGVLSGAAWQDKTISLTPTGAGFPTVAQLPSTYVFLRLIPGLSAGGSDASWLKLSYAEVLVEWSRPNQTYLNIP